MAKTRTVRATTAVDDVRRVRERLSKEAGGDIRKLAEESNRIARKYRRKLGLKWVSTPRSTKRSA
jgi:hypothetical protein